VRITRLLVVVAMVALSLACGLVTNPATNAIGGQMQTQTVERPPIATTATKIATPAPDIATITGSYHLRLEGNAHADVLGYLYDGDRVELVGEESDSGWQEIKTVEENPDDVRTGWVKAKAIEK